ncbi:MAG TPA: M20/M25/M40 family metallo-hydrolase [Acidimicrobiales bacterium]|nr:M20/M25/M40 family metallo-hydrolase [Acidimicrobiales bacterium]
MIDASAEVVDVLQTLIRNACVNDGTDDSGGESRSVDVLRALLDGPGCDLETYAPRAGRESLVARISGSDPTAPTLLLMGHTDVVPVNVDGWTHDPFGGELHDGFVWGRGAVDMLNLTSSMAVATARLARSGWRPRGTLIYLAVADEEALGTWGAEWLVQRETDAVRADYVITESGGIPASRPSGIKLPVVAAEKGSHWCTLRVGGTPGHASQPFRTDNALVTAARVVERLATYRPQTQIHDTWRSYVVGMGFPPEREAQLLDADTLLDACEALPLGLARVAHACTHTTFAPTVVQGGTKTNVIPDRVDLQVDIRTLPGQSAADIRAMLDDALGPELAAKVTVVAANHDDASASPTDTPMWASMQRVAEAFYPGSAIVPTMMVGATDARFFRRLGIPSYGFGLFSQRMRYEDYAVMFHGDDERVDVDSLRLSTEMWEALARDLLGG